MLTFPPGLRLFFCTRPIDCRQSFDGLFALVREHFQLNPLDGHLFVFRNRSGQRLKILYWDRDGLVLWYKRLELGTFQLPTLDPSNTHGEISAADLALLLVGVDVQAPRRPRYRRPTVT